MHLINIYNRRINQLQLTKSWRTIFFCLIILFSSCRKLVEVAPPTTSITGSSVFNEDAAAISVLTGIYANISASNISSPGGITSLTLYAGLSADEYTLWSGVTNQTALAFYENALTGGNQSTTTSSQFWTNSYNSIFKCNDAVQGLNASNTLTPAVKQQLIGEAKFMRAFFYFYLVNLYGEVPITVTNDYKVNATLARSPIEKVYQQIIIDLKEAQTLLSENYLNASLLNNYPERVRPTKWAATALLARAYLYSSNFADAEKQATILINNTLLFGLSPISNVFLSYSSGNKEAIWQLQPVTTVPTNTWDGRTFIISESGPGTAGNFGAYLSDTLIKSFEAGDLRKQNWVGNITIGTVIYNFPFKYKINSTTAPVTEFTTMLRLGEQYLIRAEARAQIMNLSGSQSDLNVIRIPSRFTKFAGQHKGCPVDGCFT